MALNVATFRTRALTSLFFVAVMLGGFLWNQWSFFVLLSIIHWGCWLEYQRVIAAIDPGYESISPYHRFGVILAGWCFLFYFAGDIYQIGSVSLHNIGKWGGFILLFVLPILEILLSQKINFRNIGYSLLGLLYISFSLGLFVDIRGWYALDIGKLIVIAILVSFWINDTMAYLVGSLIGKTQLTKISPSKTWEGTLGGIILAIIVMGLVGYVVSGELDWQAIAQWMGLAAVAAIMGTVGDILESKLKRMAGVKDSGHILPGHGGFLDRFDSLLFALPFVWLFLYLFVK